MTERIVDHESARRAALIATIWVPLAVVVAAEAAIIIVGATGAPQLITHWGAGSERTQPWWVYAVLVAAIGFPVIGFIGFFIARATQMAGRNAWMPAIVMGVTIFHALGLGVGEVVFNASRLAPALPLIGGAALGVAGAFLTWWLLPREAPMTVPVEPADTLPVRPGEVAVWTGRAELPAWFVSGIAGVGGLLVALGVTLFLTAHWHAWPIFVAPAVLFTVLLLTGQFDASAGPRGFVARSAFGWPRLSIPAADLAEAAVIHVDPLADFGGWGVRRVIGPRGKGRLGIITRSGAALEVFRPDGRSVVVTVDDAGTAAAVLATYAHRPTSPA